MSISDPPLIQSEFMVFAHNRICRVREWKREGEKEREWERVKEREGEREREWKRERERNFKTRNMRLVLFHMSEQFLHRWKNITSMKKH